MDTCISMINLAAQDRSKQDDWQRFMRSDVEVFSTQVLCTVTVGPGAEYPGT